MTVKECYETMGADYESVLGRLRNDERIQKFLLRVPEDPSYALLCDAMEKKDIPEAFRAAHTMKGVGQNLSLTRLYQAADRLTELLRNQDAYQAEMGPALEEVKREYARMVECVGAFRASL